MVAGALTVLHAVLAFATEVLPPPPPPPTDDDVDRWRRQLVLQTAACNVPPHFGVELRATFFPTGRVIVLFDHRRFPTVAVAACVLRATSNTRGPRFEGRPVQLGVTLVWP